MFVGITVGMIIGSSVGWVTPATRYLVGSWLVFPGQLFLATINMNDTALFQAVAAIFLDQVFNINIGFSGMMLVVVMAIGASIGSPATPGVSIVILSITLTTISVLPAGIALIMRVDQVLEMSRTAINVTGDLVATKLMDKWKGSEQIIETELAQPEQHETIRHQTGVDVITYPQT